MRLLLLRHGATRGNELRQYVGRRTDEPLSDEGRAQCERAGADTSVRRVYASPMRRAVQTARLCFPRARLRLVEDLAEFDFGAFEGRCADELWHDAAYRSWVDGDCRRRCPGGESMESFAKRTADALASALLEASRSGESRVAVVAHGGTVMAAMCRFADGAAGLDSYFDWHVQTCEGYVVDVRMESMRMVFANPQRIKDVRSLPW